MACCSDLIYFCKQCIQITIDRQGFYILEMTACLPFYPEFLPASAEIRHLSGLDRLIERFLIHICQHQDLLCLIMLDDDRDQALIIGLKL